MSRASLHPAVAEVVDSRRLGSLEASRQHFTVSREAALLRLREQALEHEQARGGERWLWTLALVRAANALSELAEVEIDVEALETEEGGEELEVTSFDVVTPGVELDELDLADMLAGALAPDLGEPISGADAALRQRRFRMLIGRAINHALAHDPVAIELSTPAGGRRFERREQVGEGRDPYAERRVAGLEGHSRFVLRVVAPRPSLGARLGRWVRGRSQTERVLRELWTKHRLREREEEDEDEGPAIPLGPVLGGEPVELGKHALFGPRARLADPPSSATLPLGIWLVRDGVLLLDLLPTLGPAGILRPELTGWIDCPSLRLTADERAVVKDGAFELLVAWLADYLERRGEGGAVSWPTSPFVDPERSGDDEAPGLRSASGRPIVREQLADDIRRGRELVYVWRHQAREVAAYERAKILAPSPAELDLLRAEFPDARLVPLRALGGETKIDPENLSSLRGASYEPLVLAKHSPVELPARAGRSPGVPPVVRISVEAYVHRSSAATLGFIAILAYERRVAQISDRARVFSGVTLLCRVSSGGEDEALAADALDFGALRRDHLAVSAIADACRKHALAHWEALLIHVMSRAKPWENPLLRGVLEQLGARQIELSYREIEGEGDESEPELRLAWRDTAALGAEVGERVDDGGSRSLRDALRQLREPGYVVLAHASRSYASLRSADPRLRPWRVHGWARPALERVAGRYCLLEMPAVPEAYPLVRARDRLLDDQRHLLRDAGEVRKDRERASVDPHARIRLLGQLLVARGLGRDTLGLEDRPLLERYDPRALTPTRLVSLAAALAERPRPGLVPVGAVHRGLPAPVIEATPGLAALLHAVEGFVPASLERAGAGAAVVPDRPELADEGPVRRRARELPPLLARTVAHPLVVGRLFVAGDGESEGVDLWLEGLRVGEIQLDEPLGRVSGRLVLTSRAARIDRQLVKREVTDQARTLIADALRQRALLPPLGDQRERLDHFIDYARAVVRQRDPFGLAEALGVAEPDDRGRRVATLQQMSLAAAPLRPLPDRRAALLAQVVRQSLAMRVHFDTSLLSWRAAKLGKRRRDGSLEISFGLRNGWIQRGLDEDRELDLPSHKRAALLAGVLVIAEFFDQAREREELALGPEHLTVALWRLMKMS